MYLKAGQVQALIPVPCSCITVYHHTTSAPGVKMGVYSPVVDIMVNLLDEY